ncbi:MAG: prepilin-type N-terminal cleavage/methylation domain-containing protein [Verrucomicrobiae bacterium]|nr:prepilin-type N-terminal cleavage/methylation domain-containing protein [Verrucomicrobiae bacterium]
MRTVPFQAPRPRRRSLHGFSLLEMLVGIGILSVVVLALYALFDQTQKALRANINQVDVSEGGRSVMDLLVRDVRRAAVTGVTTNFVVDPVLRRGQVDIERVVPPGTNLVVMRTAAGLIGPRWATVFGDDWRRDTALHELFYLVEQQPGRWVGAGLFVAGEDPMTTVDGVGTLWRYEDENPMPVRGALAGNQVGILNNRFLNNTAYRTNHVSRLIDGVVFFRVTPFGPQGQPLDDKLLREIQLGRSAFPVPPDVVIGPGSGPPPFPVNGTFFRNRALPSAVEIELGILPTQLVEQYRNLDAPSVRERFLANNAPNVLVFRQRISLPAAPAQSR